MSINSFSADSSVTLSAVDFSWPDGTVVFTDLSAILPAGVTSLVGANGAGKTTLLNLVAGRLTPQSGSVGVPGTVGLVDQHPQADPHRTVADVLRVADKIAALHRIENGSVDADDYTVVGDDWDVESLARAEISAIGLGDLELDRPVGNISGGEATLLAVAAQLLSRPTVLILDEPTNNLDRRARGLLFDAIDRFSGSVLLVSHDLELLDRVEHTVELYRGRLRSFGGPYSLYREALAAEQETAAAAVVTASNDLRRQKREMADAQTKLAHRAQMGRKAEAEKRVPKIIAHGRKQAAQVSAGKLRTEVRADVDAARERLHDVSADVRKDLTAKFVLPHATTVTRREIVVDDRLPVNGPERIRIAGANGSGKTTLLHRLIDDAAIRVRYCFVPQLITFDAEERSIAQAMSDAHPELTPVEVHCALARMLFRGERSKQQLSTLSGGERLRVALAIGLAGSTPAELLVLDEPTNNLDLDTVEQLAAALRDWTGAIVLVSHDESFVARVGVSRTVTLDVDENETDQAAGV
ncbi:ABC-F family ATP-binding cassette domain-containing protein [Gordonia sp. TBRC 11910]|uniref:ABC-F family ATP-binding cassette domain-containing protein n=1 Tax=Gordonia asplenii TaxID=2725283 RepID=A0A848KQL6_9ACTN|nr:ATP-binding cassette domain-containing protein [Gordonia asplenii]NMO00640.1 ABC-F family ATP-binding cassette domain-containing protein [Gordonia asplenii]